MSSRSLVSVLTPVYNGEAYLAECIESVLGQTYEHLEYVVVDNASTDATGEILRTYAARDRRLRVHTNDRLVPVIQNHNLALGRISPEAKWCKFVSADDTLFPQCLERMVALADAHPSVGLVSAYQEQGPAVGLDGRLCPGPVTSGRTIARHSLFGLLNVFGGPTAHMLRADFVRRRDPFYDESNLHADTAACYDILRTSDFGFVHQVLTFARAHAASLTYSVARRLNTYLLGHLKILTRYGPEYLTPEEYEHVLRQRLDTYYKFLARTMLRPGAREIWTYHRDGLRDLGLPLSRRRLATALWRQARQVLMSPGTQLPNVVRLIRRRDGDQASWRQWWAPTGFEAVKPLSTLERRDDADPAPDDVMPSPFHEAVTQASSRSPAAGKLT